MKRLLLIVMVVVMVAGLTACSSAKASKASEKDNGKKTSAKTEEPTKEPEKTEEPTKEPEPTEEPKETQQKNNKVAHLTFDDGPSSNTKRVLDILDKNDVKGTFFVTYNSKEDETYKDIVKRGHIIALHTYTHDYGKIYCNKTAYFDGIQKLSDHVKELTGVESKIVRFPGGTSNTVSRKYCKGVMSSLVEQANEKGYTYVDWNVSSGDASGNNIPKDTLIENVKDASEGLSEAFILMHDTDAKDTTVEALPTIIKNLKADGFEILPITEESGVCHHKANN